MSPLSPDEYAPGRRVRSPDGTDYDVLDNVLGTSGNRYVVTAKGLDGAGGLVPEERIRESYEARDPEEVANERASETEPQDSVTDETDVTGDEGQSPRTDSRSSGSKSSSKSATSKS